VISTDKTSENLVVLCAFRAVVTIGTVDRRYCANSGATWAVFFLWTTLTRGLCSQILIGSCRTVKHNERALGTILARVAGSLKIVGADVTCSAADHRVENICGC